MASSGNRSRNIRRNAGRTSARRIERDYASYSNDGNAARRIQEIPDYREESREAARRRALERELREARQIRSEREQRQMLKKQRQMEKTRSRQMTMNRAFIVIIAISCAFLMGISVYYLQLKSQITTSRRTVASLESQLASIKEDNDAYYNNITSDVDLNAIKKIAIGRLGMKKPTDDQLEYYVTSRSTYIRQYQDVEE